MVLRFFYCQNLSCAEIGLRRKSKRMKNINDQEYVKLL